MERVEWLSKLQPKFRTYPPNFTLKQWTDVEDLLLACSYQIGVTNAPEPEMLQKMCTALKSQSPDLNASELNEAFDLYAFQKLDFKTPHFNSFDLLFLANIVMSYKRYQASQRAKLNKIKKPIAVLPEPKISESESHKIAMDFFNRNLIPQFEQYKKDKQYNWSELDEKLIFFYLEEIGIFNLNIQQKKAFADDILKQLRMEISHLAKQGLVKKDKKTKEFTFEPFYVKKRCQSAMVRRFIEMSDFEETDLRELIEEAIEKKE